MEAVTVTVLDISLALVHIPRHRLHHFSHPLIKHILAKTPSFLNISCNTTEVSIIASGDSLSAFKKVAKRDQKRLMKVAVSGGSTLRRRRRSVSTPTDVVQISEPWSAIQIDSHGDQLDDAATRIREISALLSGISILYQSSHTTDFIFVQSNSLPSVIKILTKAGYLTPSDSEDIPPPSSSALSEGLHISLTSSSPSSLSSFHESDAPLVEDDTRHHLAWDDSISNESTSTHTQQGRLTPAGSPTPPIPSIQILDDDLVVVGLSESPYDQEAWTMKLIKLLLFTDTIVDERDLSTSPSRRAKYDEIPSSYFLSSAEEPDDEDSNGISSSSESLSGFSSSLSSSGESSSDCSLDQQPRHLRFDSTYTQDSSSSPSTSRSPLSPFFSKGDKSSSPSKTTPPTSPHTSKFMSDKHPHPLTLPHSSSRGRPRTSTPFFSLTRTTDSGTSLTSDIRLLAALFPPGAERALIYCKDEFEVLEREQERERERRGRERAKKTVGGVWDTRSYHDHDDQETDEPYDKKGILKCLHIDLQAFGLDKHGFVNRFSKVLHSNDISHLYSSTFQTANLLVDAGNAERAAKLLSLM